MQTSSIDWKRLTVSEGIELGVPVGILLGVIVSNGIPLFDSFRDGIELLLFDNEEDDNGIPSLGGKELGRSVGILLGVFFSNDWFRDGIKLRPYDNEVDDHEIPTLDGLDDNKEGLKDRIISGNMFCPYEWKTYVNQPKERWNLK